MQALIPKSDANTQLSVVESITRSYILESLSESTRKSYASNFRVFFEWCQSQGLSALPSSPEVVAMFLAAQASAGVKVSTVSHRIVTINYAHKSAGLESPTSHKIVRDTLKGIRRLHGTTRNKKFPATANHVTTMVSHCPKTLTGLRDKALLLLGFSGAFRRSELVALNVEDLEDVKEGYRVHIRRSKTDQTGEGHTIAIVNGRNLKVVKEVKEWIKAAGITTGAVFRPITKNGIIKPVALSDRSVANIVKYYAKLAGLDPEIFSGHSLRSGYLTSAAEAGASILKMMEVSRHKKIDELLGYVRSAELFKDHSGKGFL